MATDTDKSMFYKIDWLAFTIPNQNDVFLNDNDGETVNFKLIQLLNYDLNDFEEIPGRYFYNSGLSLGGYVNVYYNDFSKKLMKNTNPTRNYVFTGQGCTDLAQKIESDWNWLFNRILELGGKITRIDLAIDDFEGVLDFEVMESHLKAGHYRSSKKSYNVVKQADVNGHIKGYTIYIGTMSKSAKGCYYVRFYDKLAQYVSKNQLPPPEAIANDRWQRYEISFTKTKAMKIVDLMISDGQTIGSIYHEAMRDIVEFLEFDEKQKNKSRWKVCDWWESFLGNCEKIKLGEPERDADLGRMLEWVRVAVLPAIHTLDEILSNYDFDIYELMKRGFDGELSKKQKRLINNSRNLSIEEIARNVEAFMDGGF